MRQRDRKRHFSSMGSGIPSPQGHLSNGSRADSRQLEDGQDGLQATTGYNIPNVVKERT